MIHEQWRKILCESSYLTDEPKNECERKFHMPVNGLINDVFLSCRAQLARAVSRIVPPHDIEDIVQETYVRACQFGTKNEVREPRALMVKIARNLALDRIKLASTRLKSSEDFETVLEHLHQDIDEPFNRICAILRSGKGVTKAMSTWVCTKKSLWLFSNRNR